MAPPLQLALLSSPPRKSSQNPCGGRLFGSLNGTVVNNPKLEEEIPTEYEQQKYSCTFFVPLVGRVNACCNFCRERMCSKDASNNFPLPTANLINF